MCLKTTIFLLLLLSIFTFVISLEDLIEISSPVVPFAKLSYETQQQNPEDTRFLIECSETTEPDCFSKIWIPQRDYVGRFRASEVSYGRTLLYAPVSPFVPSTSNSFEVCEGVIDMFNFYNLTVNDTRDICLDYFCRPGIEPYFSVQYENTSNINYIFYHNYVYTYCKLCDYPSKEQFKNSSSNSTACPYFNVQCTEEDCGAPIEEAVCIDAFLRNPLTREPYPACYVKSRNVFVSKVDYMHLDMVPFNFYVFPVIRLVFFIIFFIITTFIVVLPALVNRFKAWNRDKETKKLFGFIDLSMITIYYLYLGLFFGILGPFLDVVSQGWLYASAEVMRYVVYLFLLAAFSNMVVLWHDICEEKVTVGLSLTSKIALGIIYSLLLFVVTLVALFLGLPRNLFPNQKAFDVMWGVFYTVTFLFCIVLCIGLGVYGYRIFKSLAKYDKEKKFYNLKFMRFMIISIAFIIVLEVWFVVEICQLFIGWDVFSPELFFVMIPFVDCWVFAFICVLIYMTFNTNYFLGLYGKLMPCIKRDDD